MQKSRYILAIAVLVLLPACTGGSRLSAETKNLLENPLYAEWYYNDIVDDLMSIEIRDDPMLKDADRKAAIAAARQEALEQSRQVAQRKLAGRIGTFTGPEDIVEGRALLVGGMLYFGPDFLGMPGPDLHVYLTQAVDPTEGAFPDETALDLGSIKSPYESQQYELAEGTDASQYRTAVLWDKRLRRLYAFAQLQQQ